MADILLTLAVIVFAVIGAKRGFARTLIGLVSSLLSLIFGAILYKPLALMLTASPVGEVTIEYAKKLLENSADTVGKINISDATVEMAAELIINVLSFAVIMLAVKVALHIVAGAINIIVKLPVVKQADSLLGTLLGAISGLLFCYIVIGAIYALKDSGCLSAMAESIENSILAINFYEGNLVSEILTAFMK